MKASNTMVVSVLLPLESLQPSPTNPRKDADPKALEELTESVRQVGILQPILVRPLMGVNATGLYEIVAGHRRYQAALAAGLLSIPAVVRELTDDEALELQAIENLQREDLSEIEEAEGFAALKARGRSVEEIAAKVGKSKGTIYARLKLLELPDSARAALKAGKLDASVALLIARIPDPALQKKATKDVLGDRGLDGWSYRRASEHFQRNYMLALKGAPFPVGDPDLLPSAGACTDCPHRTGNAKDLFGDVPSADVCTLPFCYEAKKAAAGARAIEEAKASGLKVLSKKEAADVFQRWQGVRVAHNAPFVDLQESCQADPKRRHWQSLLGKDAPEAVIAIDGEGRARRLLPKTEAQKVLREKYDWARPASSGGASSKSPAERKAELEAKIRTAAERDLRTALVDRSERQIWNVPGPALWRVMVHGLIARAWSDTLKSVCRRRALEGKRAEDVLLKATETMDEEQLRGLAVEIAIGPFVQVKGGHFLGGEAGQMAWEGAQRLFELDYEHTLEVVRLEFTGNPQKVPGKKSGKARKADVVDPRVRACIYCGCTEAQACEGVCSWIETEDGSDVCNSPSCLSQYDGLDPDVVRNMSGAKDPARSGSKKASKPKKSKKTRAPKPKKTSKRAAGKKASR